MALFLVATPIGNPNDISDRAKHFLQNTQNIILEERKEGTAFLRTIGITGRNYLQLNEHSTKEDLQELLKLCESSDVALITDCGTPGFCDPGADLVKLCRQKKIPVKSLPGASSLMTLLSLSSERLDQFVFRGFVSNDSEVREKEWPVVAKENRALVLMDTPYRLQKMLGELKSYFPSRKILIVLDMTQENEIQWEGLGSHIDLEKFPKKAEFMVLVYPK